jgi:hypothetical protein
MQSSKTRALRTFAVMKAKSEIDEMSRRHFMIISRDRQALR